ncbi:MAG TPA: hypothetical protein V6C81_01300 [Planktothrix sp.]
MPPAAKNAIVVIVCVLLFAFIGWTHEREATLLSRNTQARVADQLPNAEAVELCALGYDQLLADWYWLSFVQYVGDVPARAKDQYAEAPKYLDLIVGLDPRFTKAYYFAAFIIGSEMHEPQRAAEFIERGLRANQDDWYLPFVAGINQYLYAHNEIAAAKYYRMAAKYPGAPPWLARQADILDAHIPAFIKEINTWNNIYETSEQSIVKERARSKLIMLWMRVFQSPNAPAQIKERAKQRLEQMGVTLE